MNRYRAVLETLRTIALIVIALVMWSPCTPPAAAVHGEVAPALTEN